MSVLKLLHREPGDQAPGLYYDLGITAGTGALLGGALSLGGSALSASGASGAAGTQQNAANNAAAQAKKAQQDYNATIYPYEHIGDTAQNSLGYMLGLPGYERGNMPGTTITDYEHTPGYDNMQSTASAMAGYNTWKAAQDALPNPGAAGGQDFGYLLKPFTPGDLTNDPGYQFELNQGTKSINNAQAARGNFLSGGAMKALAQYGNDYAGTKYNEAFGRDQTQKNSIYNMLTGQQSIGENAAVGAGNSGINTANTIGNYMTQGANANAAGQIQSGNAIAQGMGTVANMFGTGGSQYGGTSYGGGLYSTINNPGSAGINWNNAPLNTYGPVRF